MRYKRLILAGLLLAAGLVGLPMATHALSPMRGGASATVARDESVNSSVYLAGSTVTVAGTVKGDVYCAGQTIDITGTVEGDVMCAGQTVSITGTVAGNIRVAGQTVTLAGPVGHNVTAFGQTVSLGNGSTVTGDVTAFAQTLQLSGKIGRDLVGGGQAATLFGEVARNANISGENITLVGGSRIGGDFDYTSRGQAAVASTAVVAGQTARHDPPKQSEVQVDTAAARAWSTVYWFGAMFVLGLLLLACVPRTFKTADSTMVSQGGWALLAGIGALIMTPIVAILLFVTVLGIPAAIALLLLWVVAMMTGTVYSGYSVGRWVIMQAKWKIKALRVTSLALGLLIFALVMLVPIVGGLLFFVAFVWGLGGIVLMVMEYLKNRTADVEMKKAKA